MAWGAWYHPANRSNAQGISAMQQGSDRFRLVVRRGPTPSHSWDLEGELVTVGRDVSNDIVINDAEASRQHLRLRRRRGGGYVLEDLGSTNGTFVNGQRLSGARSLHNGDMIGMGETVTLAYERVPGTEGIAVATGPWSREPASDEQPEAEAAPLPAAPEAAEVPAPARQVVAREVLEEPAPAYDYDPYDLPEEEEEPRRNTMRWIGIGCIVLLLLCCCFTLAAVVLIDQACLWGRIPLLSDLLQALGFYFTC